MAKAVEMVEHDPSWARQFVEERTKLADILPMALSIEHVGSTSVPGLVAKPIIDIMVVVPDVGAADPDTLAHLGYAARPDVFADDPEHEYFVKDTHGRRTHHLHIWAYRPSRPSTSCSETSLRTSTTRPTATQH